MSFTKLLVPLPPTPRNSKNIRDNYKAILIVDHWPSSMSIDNLEKNGNVVIGPEQGITDTWTIYDYLGLAFSRYLMSPNENYVIVCVSKETPLSLGQKLPFETLLKWGFDIYDRNGFPGFYIEDWQLQKWKTLEQFVSDAIDAYSTLMTTKEGKLKNNVNDDGLWYDVVHARGRFIEQAKIENNVVFRKDKNETYGNVKTSFNSINDVLRIAKEEFGKSGIRELYLKLRDTQ